MKKKIGLLSLMVLLIAGACKDKFEISRYYEDDRRDTLLADIITYIYVKPPYATWQTRFEPRFRRYYVSQLNKFRVEKYYVDEHNVHYYYLIRPARSAEGTIRGVGGTFRLDESGRIVSFREVFNTPVAPLPVLQQRGEELFKRLVREGNVDDYLKHPDYIEWPDNITYYDTIQYEWLVKPGL